MQCKQEVFFFEEMCKQEGKRNRMHATAKKDYKRLVWRKFQESSIAGTSVTWTRVRVSVSDSGAGVRFVRIFGDTANNTWNPTRVRGIRLGKKIKTWVSG